MNKLLFAIFLFGCSLAFATVDERKIDIYFANGIDTTRRQAELALFDINISYQVYNSTLYKSVGQWKVSYNTTHGIGIDLYESTLQKVYEDEPGTSFVPVFWNLPTVAGMFDIYFSNIVSKIVRKVARHSIKQYASTAATYLARRAARTYNSRFGRHFTEEELELLFDEVFDHLIDEGVQSFVNTTEDEIIQQERDDLNTQLNKYRQSIRRGHGVVVIAHSQGNFFTNRAFDEFGVSSNINHDLWMKNYFRALGVATPTDNVIGNNSPYITYDNDIIQLIPWSLPPNVPNPHRYGIENALGEQIVVDNTYSIEAHNFISSYMATPSTKAAILGYIGGEIVEHNNAQSQWQKAYDIGCPSSCEHRIGVSHKFDSSLDINMTGIDVLPFDETGKLYPLDNGTYVKADPEGKRVKALGSGLVCHELQNDQNATIDTIARGQSAPEPHGGAVEVTLSWGESGNDFDLDLDMPSSVRDVQSCMMEHEYVASEFEIYPGHYDVNVSYAGGEYRSDTCYVTIQVPGETQVLKFDTNGSGSNPRHVATIVVEYIDNRPVLRLSAAVPGSLIFSFGGSASGGNSTVNRIVHESEFIRYTPPTPYVCSPAMSCGCKPCEYTIVPDLAQVIKGPLSGADIALFNAEGFRNGTPLYSGKTGTGDDLYMAGLLNIPPSLIDSLDDNGLYIFEVSGGVDIDRDDDMRVDEVFTPNNAVLHAVLTGADLKAIKPKVSVLTEIAYQIVRDEIMVGTDPLRILDTLDDVATRLLSTKIYPNSPDPLNHTDLAQWLPTIDKGILFADYDSRIRPIIEKLQAQEDIYQDAYDVVYYPDGVAPVLKSALFDVPEDTPVGTVLGRISVMSEGQSPVIGMTLSGEGQEAFSIDAAGTVTLIQPLDYEQKQLYSLYVHAGNEQGVGLPVALYVQVGDVTDAPVITDFSARPVYSSFAVGRAVGQVSFSEGSSGVTSVRLGGADGGYFRADILGNITVAKQLENYLVKKVYRFSVTVSNLSGDSRPADIVLNVSDAQELPVLAAIDVNVTENSVAGTVIGTADVLSEGQSPITSFTLGGSSVFAINEQGDIIVTEAAQLDYEQRQTYELSVSAYNSFGESKAVNVTVHVNNVPDTPPQVISTSMSIDENSPAGTAVGVLRVTPGEAAVNTIGISGDGHEYFRADPDGTVRVAGSLDYESRSRFHLTFSATSILGTSNVSSLDIAVNNVPEVAPTLQATAVTRHFHEIGVGQTLANVLIDAGDTPVQVITLQPDSPFAVRPNGELYLAEALSGDQTEFNLTASAGNGFGLSDPVGVNIRVIATPVLSDTRLSVDENAPSGTVVGNVGIISEGMAAIESFSADSPLMTIDPDGTVHVASGADLDYEIRNHYDLNVSARNRFGVGASVRLSISVNNVPEKAPVLQDLNITVDKETAVGSVIGNLLFSRGDTAIETMELSPDSPFSATVSGQVVVKDDLLEREETSFVLRARASNGFGASNDAEIIIRLNSAIRIIDFDASAYENTLGGTAIGNLKLILNGNSIETIELNGVGSEDFEVDLNGTIRVAEGVTLRSARQESYHLGVIANGTSEGTADIWIRSRLLASVAPGYSARGIVLSEDAMIAYLEDGAGLYVIDVNDSEAPMILGSVPRNNLSGGIALLSEVSKAYITGNDGTLEIVDVSDPAAPFAVGSIHTGQRLTDVVVSPDGMRAYITEPGSMKVVDVSDPAALSIIGSTMLADPLHLVLSPDGTTVYIAVDYEGLKVIDVRNPFTPSLVGTFQPLERIKSVALSPDGTIAYALDGQYLWIIDCADPASPSVLRLIYLSGYGQQITLSANGEKAYVASYVSGHTYLRIIDISNPLMPSILGSIGVSNTVYDIAVSPGDEIAYLANHSSGLSIVAVSGFDIPDKAPGLLDFYTVVDEDIAVGSVIGKLRILYEGHGGILSFSLEGEGAEDFAIDPDGLITLAGTIDSSVNKEYRLTAVVVNGVGESRVPVIIQVHTVPEIRPFVGEVNSQSPAGTMVGRLDTWVDDNTTLGEISLTGTGAENFTVNLSGEIFVAEGAQLHHFVTPYYDLQAVAANRFGRGEASDVKINVSPVAMRIKLAEKYTGYMMFSDDETIIYTVDYSVFNNAVFKIINISNPLGPLVLGEMELIGTGRFAITPDGNNIITPETYSNRVQKIDVTDPEGLSNSFVNVPNQVLEGIALSPDGKIAYVTGLGNLFVSDVGQDSNGSIISSLEFPGYVHDVTVSSDGSTIYVSSSDDKGSDLTIIDVNDSAEPLVKGSIRTFGGYSFEKQVVLSQNGTMAFVSGYGSPYISGIEVIDVTDPASPFVMGSIIGFSSVLIVDFALTLDEMYAIAADYDGKVFIIDLSDPSQPELRSSFYVQEVIQEIRMSSDRRKCYMMDYDGHLDIVDLEGL